PTFRPRPRAARRPSSMGRSSIRKIRPPISRASQSNASKCDETRGHPAPSLPRRRKNAMNMSVMKAETVTPAPAEPAKVLPLSVPKRAPLSSRIAGGARDATTRLVPPIVVVALILLVWELLCRRTGATLPPPSRVVKDTWELITDPFFDNGGVDKGLFWHLSASLQRVALGYALASIVGVALGTLVGQSTWAMRGLDPIFQVLRTVPPLAWLPLSLAAFRNGQPSAIFVIFVTAIC